MGILSTSKILVTGATGFVGTTLVPILLQQADNYSLSLACRKDPSDLLSAIADIGASDRVDGVFKLPLTEKTDWNEALEGCHAVVHLAARAHVMKETLPDPLGAYREINLEGTRRLAEQAAKKGVKRFIYLSSIKVNGEATELGKSYAPDDRPCPEDDYGRSKWEAEQALMSISLETGMQVLIVRPPLIYGPGVKANFLKLIEIVKKGYPLPLKAIHNQRSLLSVYNLVDFILCCLRTELYQSQVFCISDGQDLSIADLLRKLAHALHKPSRLFYCPGWLLQGMAYLMGRKAFFQRLAGSLQIDNSKAETVLKWRPPMTMEVALQKMFNEQGCSYQAAKESEACVSHDQKRC